MSRNQFTKFLIFVLVFLLPSQLSYHFWPSYSFIFGIRVDYFAPTIYLTDLLVFILVAINFKRLFKYKNTLLILLSIALLNTHFSILPQVTIFKFLKVIEYICLAIVIKKEDIIKPLYYSLIFYSLIGITQFILSKTTGIFYLLGERNFEINTPGIALVEILGRNYLRAYSTFSHPNALAGYLGLSFIYLVHKKYKFNWLLVFVIICFLLTFSLSAFIALNLYFLLKNTNSKFTIFSILILSLILPVVSPFFLNFIFENSYVERLKLAVQAGKIISNHFWTGIGLGTFPKMSYIRQPVHNLFLLIFSETGIFGLITVIYLLIKNYKRYAFVVFILIVGLFDHYFLTLQQDVLLLSIIFSLW